MPFWLLIYLIFPYIPIVCSNIRVCCLWRPRRPPAPSCPCSPPVGPSTPSSGCLQKSPALVSVRADGPWRPCKLTKPLHTCSICIFIFTWRKFHECHLHMPLESYVDQWWCYFRGIKEVMSILGRDHISNPYDPNSSCVHVLSASMAWGSH